MHTDAEIEHLEELLSNFEIMPDAMCVSELDGYVAGLLLCPEMIVPSEWLPEVWALDGEPEFANIEQAQATIGSVMAHYNRVAENLASRNKPYEIVLDPAEGDDQPLWEFWVGGFEQAMSLRPEAWRAYFDADDTKVEAAFSVICGLIEMEREDSSLPTARQDQLREHACNLIPNMVVIMNDWLKSRPIASGGLGAFNWPDVANQNHGPARSTKVGRNDPCTCGSGLKHKKCCAAN